jgi:hypothetical protein
MQSKPLDKFSILEQTVVESKELITNNDTKKY